MPNATERQTLLWTRKLIQKPWKLAPGPSTESVEGWVPDLASESELRDALEKAFDYRGDVAVTKKDGIKIGRLYL